MYILTINGKYYQESNELNYKKFNSIDDANKYINILKQIDIKNKVNNEYKVVDVYREIDKLELEKLAVDFSLKQLKQIKELPF